jgi:hypothetical protein
MQHASQNLLKLMTTLHKTETSFPTRRDSSLQSNLLALKMTSEFKSCLDFCHCYCGLLGFQNDKLKTLVHYSLE